MTAWLWLDSEGPDDIPLVLNVFLVTRRKLDPDYLAGLQCAQRVDYFQGEPVVLFRLYDPVEVPSGVCITDYTSLDDRPELIHYEGHIDPHHHWVNLIPGTLRQTKPTVTSKAVSFRSPIHRIFRR